MARLVELLVASAREPCEPIARRLVALAPSLDVDRHQPYEDCLRLLDDLLITETGYVCLGLVLEKQPDEAATNRPHFRFGFEVRHGRHSKFNPPTSTIGR